jgi:hypothetical protein
MNSVLDPSIESEIRSHLWAYFSLHAQQRMSAFQFFITLETGLIGAGLFILQSRSQFANSYWAAMIGPMIIMLAFVFWKIDQRTRDLISKSEQGLKELEAFFLTNSKIVSNLPFSLGPQNLLSLRTFPLLTGRPTYSKSFGTVFLACSIFGAVFTAALVTSLTEGK